MTTRKIIVGKCIALLLFSLFSAALAPAYGEERNARYELSATVPEAQIRALKNAGWDDEKIGRFSEVYGNYRRAHAFRRLPNPIPGEHLLLLAEWINVVTGHEVDPYLTAAIHQQEVTRGRGIGKCSFYGNDSIGPEGQAGTEKKAFGMIIADIRKNPRWRTINKSLPVVSCPGKNVGWGGDVGYFQIRPTVWLHYRDKVAKALGLKTASPYELIPAITAANFILHDKVRYLKLSASEVNLENSLYFAQVAAAYNAGASNAKDTVHKYGIAVYETAREMRDATKNIALNTACVRFIFTYPDGRLVCKDR